MTSGFDLGHDLDLEFSRSNIEFAISQPKMVRLPRNEKQTYWLNSRPQMWPMVWIYQIMTGVTSVVGVPSTHLVFVIIRGPRNVDIHNLWGTRSVQEWHMHCPASNLLFQWTYIRCITATSRDHHGFSNGKQLNCLLNSLFKLTRKKTSMLFWRESTSHWSIPLSKGP